MDEPIAGVNGLTGQVIKRFFAVYNELGGGFPEAVYGNALALVLSEAGLRVEQEARLHVAFRGRIIGEFRADLVVEQRLLVETKACQALAPAHHAQLANYLRVSGLAVGLLLNFGPEPQVRRVIETGPRGGRPSRIREAPSGAGKPASDPR